MTVEYDMQLTAEMLKAAGEWCEDGVNMAPVQLEARIVEAEDSADPFGPVVLMVAQGDERAVFDHRGDRVWITPKGRILHDADIEALADEAEAE